jgi:hypothetical protein
MTAHLLDSLQAAARLAIAHDNTPGSINLTRWATTYRCSTGDVEEALKIAANGSRKLPEEIAVSSPPAITQEPEGK